MEDLPPSNRCRLVLVASPQAGDATLGVRVLEALAAGDVASLILDGAALDDASFQRFAECVTGPAQELGVAVMIAGDTRIAGRVGADGMHVEGGLEALKEALGWADGRLIVGAGRADDRDTALELGEAQPDYLFFGRLGFDRKPEPHPRNLALGRWWAEMIRIPCIVQAGSEVASVESVAATGCDFVALGSAVFGEGIDAADAVRRANALLEEAPPLGGETAA